MLGGIVLCTVLAGCGSNGSSGAPGVDPPGSSASRAAASTSSPGPEGVQRVTLEAVNSLYRPANISAHTGTIEITVKNRDKVLHNLTVAIGCTGGRHRSVVVVEDLARFFREKHIPASIDHRDLDR